MLLEVINLSYLLLLLRKGQSFLTGALGRSPGIPLIRQCGVLVNGPLGFFDFKWNTKLKAKILTSAINFCLQSRCLFNAKFLVSGGNGGPNILGKRSWEKSTKDTLDSYMPPTGQELTGQKPTVDAQKKLKTENLFPEEDIMKNDYKFPGKITPI
jgi:hypothetical protein